MLNSLDAHENQAYECLRSLTELEPSQDHLSLVAWSVLCEPGDGTAGLLIDRLGSSRSLQLIIKRSSAGALLQELSQAGHVADVDSEKKLLKDLADGLERWTPRLSLQNLIHSLQLHARIGGKIIFEHEAQWPTGLLDLEVHRPRMLWYRGNRSAIESASKSISIVGSRACTSYGENNTHEIVSAVAGAGVAVISGGAYGIDAAAHRAALAHGTPTIAILAGGLDTLYPRGNTQLLNRIIAEGALVSEVAPTVAPSKWRFLQRNRLIAAAAQCTLVVEAGFKSGARNTATHAASLQRPVFAIPGQINAPASQGCNWLIANKVADLIQGPADLLEMAGFSDLQQDFEMASLGALETRALDAVGFSPMGTGEIAKLAGLTANEARFALATLQLSGLLIQQGSKWIRAARSTV
jgi:DNA processing protein